MIESKERPILFSAPMVRAILEGRKTQTRRIIKDQPPVHCSHLTVGRFEDQPDNRPRWAWTDGATKDYAWHPWIGDEPAWQMCPHGKPGDLLWVKEAYYAWGKWVHNGKTKSGRQAWKFVQVGTSIRHMDGNKPTKTAKRDGECGWVYRHGRFMPKKHSRQTLEITDVRVQRLQEISEEDAIAEGVERLSDASACLTPWKNYRLKPGAPFVMNHSIAAASFISLWDSINGDKSSHANPWVWAITFKRNEAAGRAA